MQYDLEIRAHHVQVVFAWFQHQHHIHPYRMGWQYKRPKQNLSLHNIDRHPYLSLEGTENQQLGILGVCQVKATPVDGLLLEMLQRNKCMVNDS